MHFTFSIFGLICIYNNLHNYFITQSKRRRKKQKEQCRRRFIQEYTKQTYLKWFLSDSRLNNAEVFLLSKTIIRAETSSVFEKFNKVWKIKLYDFSSLFSRFMTNKIYLSFQPNFFNIKRNPSKQPLFPPCIIVI